MELHFLEPSRFHELVVADDGWVLIVPRAFWQGDEARPRTPLWSVCAGVGFDALGEFRTNAPHSLDVLDRQKRPALTSVIDDALCQPRANAGNDPKVRYKRIVDVEARPQQKGLGRTQVLGPTGRIGIERRATLDHAQNPTCASQTQEKTPVLGCIGRAPIDFDHAPRPTRPTRPVGFGFGFGFGFEHHPPRAHNPKGNHAQK